MSKRFFQILLLFAFLLAACNGNATEEATEEAPLARPTPTTAGAAPTPDTEGYPAPARPQPTAPAAAYPAVGEGAEGAPDSWLVLPAGEQCADSLAYPSSDSAVAVLEAAGVTLLAVEETELLVCEACGCPTSAHYRVLVSAEDFATATSLGWQPEG